MNFKKFYDTAIADNAGGGTETEVIENLSPAAMMAKQGIDSGKVVETPVEIKVEEEEIKEEQVPAAKVETPSSDEKPTSETEKKGQVEEPKKEEPPIAATPQKVQTLDEVLKQNQPDTILKALGFDDEKVALVSKMKDIDPKVVGIIQAYENGSLEDYIKELSTDYQNMSAEEVMRYQLRQEYPKATPKQFEALYQAEIVEKYKLDPDVYTEYEVERGKDLLEVKADKSRDSLIANQQKYLLPKPPEPKTEQVADNTAEKQIEAYKNEISNNPYTKDIVANKKITFGEGDEKFSYPVEADALIDILTDGKKWAETMWDAESGKPKIEHQLAVAAFALDSKKFLGEYAKHLKSVGAKEVIDPIDNASVPDKSKPSKAEAAPKSAAAAMAKHGVMVTGGQ